MRNINKYKDIITDLSIFTIDKLISFVLQGIARCMALFRGKTTKRIIREKRGDYGDEE